MKLLSGTTLRDKIREKLRENISHSEKSLHLVIIQVGDNPESSIYIRMKKKFGESIGARVSHMQFPEDVREENLLAEVEAYNRDSGVTGIILQLPVPAHIDKRRVLDAIHFTKDVDGLGSTQAGYLAVNYPVAIVPATARGIVSLLEYHGITLEGTHVVVVGRSNLVGRPTALSCLHRGATVTICHSKTKHLEEITRTADILIVACGVPKLITKDFVREGQIVVDVGIHKIDEVMCGDTDFEGIKNIVEAISPVPGGVGPLTVASLFQNLVEMI